jgi:hypothetical protein
VLAGRVLEALVRDRDRCGVEVREAVVAVGVEAHAAPELERLGVNFPQPPVGRQGLSSSRRCWVRAFFAFLTWPRFGLFEPPLLRPQVCRQDSGPGL